MKAVCLCLLLVVAIAYGAPDGYTTKYDNIDADQIVRSDRLLKRYVDCLMDRKPCSSPDASALKEILPDAIQTHCAKCNEHQKESARKIIKYLSEHKKDVLDELLNKYDPDGKFRKEYEEEAKEYGIPPKKDDK